MWLQLPWPVRARTPLLPLPTDYSANAIHIFAQQHAGLPTSASCAGKFARTPGNDSQDGKFDALRTSPEFQGNRAPFK
jgi:hypothetical protein